MTDLDRCLPAGDSLVWEGRAGPLTLRRWLSFLTFALVFYGLLVMQIVQASLGPGPTSPLKIAIYSFLLAMMALERLRAVALARSRRYGLGRRHLVLVEGVFRKEVSVWRLPAQRSVKTGKRDLWVGVVDKAGRDREVRLWDLEHPALVAELIREGAEDAAAPGA